MRLKFPTEEMRDLCESELRTQREFGIPVAEALIALLADIDAADNLDDLPAERFKSAVSGECGAYEVQITEDCFVRLSVSQYAEHQDEAGEVIRAKVRRVMIHSVEKTEVGHG
ncbi:MAG: hypothetical protein U0871_07085 [Gemmataceae bacterium]